MAGSYDHATDRETGKLLDPDNMAKMVENLGDAYETIQEMYGMIWILAAGANRGWGFNRIEEAVEYARDSYHVGLTISPGTDGVLKGDG